MKNNKMSFTIQSRSENERFARIVVAAFVAQLDPTIEELTDIKTAISEAVTNSIIHGYHNDPTKEIVISVELRDGEAWIRVQDFGQGIENLEEARMPLYTSKPELERSGMGFTIMENFMHQLNVYSEIGKGTTVEMVKVLSNRVAVVK